MNKPNPSDNTDTDSVVIARRLLRTQERALTIEKEELTDLFAALEATADALWQPIVVIEEEEIL